MAMISKASSLCDGIHSGPVGLFFFGLRVAAHSSLQKVFEPQQPGSDAVPKASTVRVRTGMFGHRRESNRAGGEKAGFGSPSLLRDTH